MAGYSWGGGVNAFSNTSYPNNFVYIDGIGAPTTQLAFNGNRPIYIWGISAGYAAGASGIYAAINYQSTGNLGSGYYATSGGTFRFVIGYSSGNLTFGRNNGIGGTAYDNADGLPFSSGIIPGSLNYAGVPSAPLSVTATASTTVSGRIVVSWNAPSDNGDSTILGYDVYRGATLVGSTASTTINADGLTPGTSYTFTVRAKNAVSNAFSTTSVASAASSAVVAPGVPTAPQTLVATPSTTVTGRVDLSWAAPATPGTGGITGYNIFRGGVQVGSTSGTGTTYSDTGRTPYTSYTYEVKARNAFADANSLLSAASNSSIAVAPGPPGAPTGLNAVADPLTPGKIDLTWTAPAVTGTGGITGYKVYISPSTLVVSQNGTGTSYSVTGLSPGATYTFYVTARNALSDAEGSQSAQSNTDTEQALGEPPAPTSLVATASTSVPGRIGLTWVAPAGTVTGYSIFDRNTVTLTDTLIAVVKSTNFKIDGLAPGVTKTYRVRARNSYTDTLPSGYPGNWGGPASNQSSATPNSDYSIPVAALAGALTDNTNVILNGTYVINNVTSNTVGYAKTASNIPSAIVISGTVTDTTNATFNGTYTITSAGASTFSYSKVAANIPFRATTGGTLTDSTNQSFNGTFAVTAVNVGAKTVSYARSGVAVASVAVPVNALPGASGTISNTTNAVYNGTNLTIVGVTDYTLTYAKVNANIAESNAAGTVTDVTNRDEYNGVHEVASIPAYDTFTYVSGGASQAATSVSQTVGDQVSRTVSPATIDIKYRSGWAG